MAAIGLAKKETSGSNGVSQLSAAENGWRLSAKVVAPSMSAITIIVKMTSA